MRKKVIYLDYAASTPVDPLVLRSMLPWLKSCYGNPSSMHALGQQSKAALEQAREEVARFLSCSASEVVFTSGATESNNLAIQGVLRRAEKKPHVICSSIEHESVLGPVQALEKDGAIETTYLVPGKDGILDPIQVEKAIKENTALISIQYANSEIGVIQPIAKIGKIIKRYKMQDARCKLLFHTDAVQAANYLDCNVESLGVDFLTLSSHKIYGPKGTGVLYIRKGITISPLFIGGGQEEDMRSGTENMAGVVGMAEALKLVQNPKVRIQHIKLRHMRDRFLKSIQKKIPGVQVTGSMESRLPNNIHLKLPGVEGKDAVLLLDQKGIAVSTGSACSERSQDPSHVLLALGFEKTEALSALRVSLGKHTSAQEMMKLEKALVQTVEQLQKDR